MKRRASKQAEEMSPIKTNNMRRSIKDLDLEGGVFGKVDTMAKSGPSGGTPMVSRSGKFTIAQYLCFSNGVKSKAIVSQDELDLLGRPVQDI